MTSDRVYEDWKQQRHKVDVPAGFEAQLIEMILQDSETSEVPFTEVRSSNARTWRNTGLTIVAVVAASILGIVRVTGCLLMGIL